MRAPAPSRLPLALLLVSLAATALAAVQATRVARSHAATARAVLGDYAGIAAWNYQRFLAAALDSVITGVLSPVMHFQMLGRVHRGNAPNAQWFVSNYLDPTFRFFDPDRVPAFLPRSYVSFMLGGDTMAVRGDGVEPARLAGLRDTLTAQMRRVHRADWDYGVVLREGGGGIEAVPYTFMPTDAGDTAVYAFLAEPALWDRLLTATYAKAPVLPEALTGGRSNRELFDASIVAPGGAAWFRTGAALPSDVVAVEPLPARFGGLVARAYLHSDLAADLVVGGLPRNRLPWVLGLLGLAGALAVLAAFQMRKEQELARLRADFVASVSHELRTPLAQIRMMVESLRLGRLDGPDRRDWALASIDRETTRLTHLVQNVLTFSRRADAVPLRLETADVGAEVEETVTGFAPLAAGRNVRLVPDVAPGCHAAIDRGAIRQLLLNLLDNAVRYGPPGQTVTVTVRGEAGGILLAVEDQGPGVPAGERGRIFNEFERGSAGRASGVGGGGIGLSIVRSVAGAHGGRAAVESAPGGGARFTVWLPGTAMGGRAPGSAAASDSAPSLAPGA